MVVIYGEDTYCKKVVFHLSVLKPEAGMISGASRGRYDFDKPEKYHGPLLVRSQAKSRMFLMIKVTTKVIIVLQGRKYHFIFGGKISGRLNRSYDPVKSHGSQISNLVKSVQNYY